MRVFLRMVKPSRGNAPSTSLFLLFCNCQKTDETKSVNQTKPKNPPSPQPKSRPSNQFSRLPQGRNSQSPAAVPPSLVRRFIRPSTQTSQHAIFTNLLKTHNHLIINIKFKNNPKNNQQTKPKPKPKSSKHNHKALPSRQMFSQRGRASVPPSTARS